MNKTEWMYCVLNVFICLLRMNYVHTRKFRFPRDCQDYLYLGLRLTELCGFLQCDEKKKEMMSFR